jgi:HSP20 family protein
MYPIAHLINAAFEPTVNSCRPQVSRERLPRTNVLEGEQDYRILMDLPGVRNEDLEINLEDESLTVKAERKLELPEGYKSRRSELASTVTFRRSFDLGSTVDIEKISAKLHDGMLTITLPKSEKTLPRRIEVK